MQKFLSVLLLIFFLLNFHPVFAQNSTKKVTTDFSLKVEGEYRYFLEKGQFMGQKRHFPALAIQPEYSLGWKKGYENLYFVGFFRLDRDPQRTHWDVRELYYQKAKNNWEINVGLKKLFWGVTESAHLVDIINQTDQVESFDGEEKLGQPLVSFNFFSEKAGTFSGFYLPYHRKRIFPGERSRLRFPVIIDGDDLGYESETAEWSPSFALRWNHYFGVADIGVSQFYGVGREPLFRFQADTIEAFYPVISQTGLDLQITRNGFLWKLESIYRYAEAQDFFAVVGGVEYTFSNVNKKGLDIGVLAEYLYDSRNELSLTGTQNDLFIGTRFALNDVNDTGILAGGIVDLSYGSTLILLEASRRLGNSFTFEIEARLFPFLAEEELVLAPFRQDSFLKVVLGKFF